MEELETRTELAAERLERLPDLWVLGVVVDHLHDQVRIVEGRERVERLADDLERFVVSRDLDSDPGEVVGIAWMGPV